MGSVDELGLEVNSEVTRLVPARKESLLGNFKDRFFRVVAEPMYDVGRVVFVGLQKNASNSKRFR